MTQTTAPAAVDKPVGSKPLSPAAHQAMRDTLLTLLDDPDVIARLKAITVPDSVPEVGAAEAVQILDLIERQMQGRGLDKLVERLVRSLVRPDALLRPHLRPDYDAHRP
jgi:hypothetical protein